MTRKPKNLYVVIAPGGDIAGVELSRNQARNLSIPGDRFVQIPLTTAQATKIGNTIRQASRN